MAGISRSVCYCTNLRRSAGAVTQYYDNALKKAGITIAQYYLLVNLSRLKSANITHWAETVGLDRSTMVRNVRVLEANEFLRPAEGNGKTFCLSAKGNRTLNKAIPLWENAQKEIRSFLGENDAEALLRIGQKLQELEPEKKDMPDSK